MSHIIYFSLYFRLFYNNLFFIEIIASKIIEDLEDENIPYTLQVVIYEIKNYKGDLKTVLYQLSGNYY